MRYRDESGERPVGPGTLLLMRHGDASAYGRPAAAYACRWVELAGAGLPELWSLLIRRHGPLLPATSRIDGLLADLAGIPPGLSPAAEARAVASAVFALIDACETGHRHHLAPVDRAIEDLLARPLAIDSVTALCRSHGVSREHLARRFHARCGTDPRSWLGRRRAEEAHALLTGSDLPPAAVAARVGYSSIRALRRCLVRSGLPGPAAARRA